MSRTMHRDDQAASNVIPFPVKRKPAPQRGKVHPVSLFPPGQHPATAAPYFAKPAPAANGERDALIRSMTREIAAMMQNPNSPLRS